MGVEVSVGFGCQKAMGLLSAGDQCNRHSDSTFAQLAHTVRTVDEFCVWDEDFPSTRIVPLHDDTSSCASFSLQGRIKAIRSEEEDVADHLVDPLLLELKEEARKDAEYQALISVVVDGFPS